ncbi:MAG: pentapeptide repeat-containing protein [Phycisphaerales bacterium]
MRPETPDLDEHTSLASIGADSLLPQSMHEHVELAGGLGDVLNARGVALSSSRVLGPVLMGSTLPGLRLVDCMLERADCSNATWVDARLVRCRFTASKATGFDARGGELRDVAFADCKMPDAFFVESTLDRVRFDRCQLSNLDLSGAKLGRVAMYDCDLRGMRLMGARIESLDLRGSRIEGWTIEPASVSKLIIDPLQAPALAHALGARVAELGEDV